MSRLKMRAGQFVIDITVLALAFWLAMLLRFDWDVPQTMFRQLVIVMPYVLLLQYGILNAFGVTRFSWRYIGLRDAVRIFAAVALSSAVLTLLRFVSPWIVPHFPLARFGIVPLGVLFANFILVFLGLSGARVSRRLLGEWTAAQRHRPKTRRESVPTVLVGAGQGGVLVAQEIARRPDLGIELVAFVDDEPGKVGAVIHGIEVAGTTDDLQEIKERFQARQALIAIASAPGTAIRDITDKCNDAALPVKIVPGTFEIVGGRVNLSRIREVAIEDLLRREPVRLDEGSVANLLRERAVMVTGAGGSIGSELCRQLAEHQPSHLVLVERAENSLFEIHSELRKKFDQLPISPVVADITDVERITAVFDEYRPNLVFHAAAHKHVPMMEWNPAEAVKNNTLGTRIIADLSDRFGVERFVMISTDKAVNPTSVMGASKRAAEIYVQALSQRSETRFATVRFGNVLGSSGSVVPIFQKQIEAGGPVTVTHPDMTRYFMTIPEAVQLVTQAAALSQGGEIFILDMGEPVKIVDLAHDLIRLSGFEPDEEIKVAFSGIRPGEKLFEELATSGEGIAKTAHPKIFSGRYDTPSYEVVQARFDTLRALCKQGQWNPIRNMLSALIPEYIQGPAESGSVSSRPSAQRMEQR
jgi:FlaA1/EpsC-like NDP-sugar epimerase